MWIYFVIGIVMFVVWFVVGFLVGVYWNVAKVKSSLDELAVEMEEELKNRSYRYIYDTKKYSNK